MNVEITSLVNDERVDDYDSDEDYRRPDQGSCLGRRFYWTVEVVS
jgi:hypothetical protein